MDKFIVMIKQIECFSHNQYGWRVEDYMYCYYTWGMHGIENNRLIIRI